MNIIIVGVFRFILFVFLQIFIFNQIELGFVIHLLMCPLYVFLLPFEINLFVSMALAFGMGAIVDVFSNTYGLHASSLLLMAYLKPIIFKFFAPREEYDQLKTPTYYDMGHLWFFSAFGALLLIHNSWFFILEAFSFTSFLYTLQKILLSFLIIYLFSLLIQVFFFRRSKK